MKKQNLSKEEAKKLAKEYCIKKGYDETIIDKLICRQGSWMTTFIKPRKLDFEPDLTTDMASMPYGFLGVRSDGTVFEGRDTHLFLEGKIEL